MALAMSHFKWWRIGLGFGRGAYQGDEHLSIQPQVLAQVDDASRDLPLKSAFFSRLASRWARARLVAAIPFEALTAIVPFKLNLTNT